MYYAVLQVPEGFEDFCAPSVAGFKSREERDRWVGEAPDDEDRKILSEADIHEMFEDGYDLCEEDGMTWVEPKGTLHINGMAYIPA